jgi:mono/diheme cytochrome c family protein
MIRPMLLSVALGAAGLGAFAFAQGKGQYIPTYYVDVIPILEKNCNSCHTAGGIAPFALDNPTAAVKWADSMARVTRSEFMPPYPPGRDSPRFINERRLGMASKQVLEDWAKAGAPLGRAPRKRGAP